MEQLLIFQPTLTQYRVPVFSELAKDFEVIVIAALPPSREGFGVAETRFEFDLFPVKNQNLLFDAWYQPQALSRFIKLSPSYVFLPTDTKNITFWIVLFVCKFRKTETILHTHGLIRYSRYGWVKKILARIYCSLANRVICYSDLSKQSLIGKNELNRKLIVVTNTFTNTSPCPPETKSFIKNNVLFIGRLREGSRIELLIGAVTALAEKYDVSLSIIGGGELEPRLKEKWQNDPRIVFHGEVYCSKKIAEISKKSLIGVYPGDAGLSVLHYMSLSVPPIAHSSIEHHFGPEPSYVVHGETGFLFERHSLVSLTNALEFAFNNKNIVREVAQKCYRFYNSTITPSYASKLRAGILS